MGEVVNLNRAPRRVRHDLDGIPLPLRARRRRDRVRVFLDVICSIAGILAIGFIVVLAVIFAFAYLGLQASIE